MDFHPKYSPTAGYFVLRDPPLLPAGNINESAHMKLHITVFLILQYFVI